MWPFFSENLKGKLDKYAAGLTVPTRVIHTSMIMSANIIFEMLNSADVLVLNSRAPRGPNQGAAHRCPIRLVLGPHLL